MERAEYGYRRRLIADEGRLWGGGPRELVPHDAYDETSMRGGEGHQGFNVADLQ
jgi:hypothetical protein